MIKEIIHLFEPFSYKNQTYNTIIIQYQMSTKYSPIFIVLRIYNTKTVPKCKIKKYKIQPIPIAIKLLGFLFPILLSPNNATSVHMNTVTSS